jgi:glycosyltransferase involved in cell wall biosynthesis
MKNVEMKISIIIPTYNRGDLLLRSVESALNQTYKNLEVIVVDDGSQDNSIAILKVKIDDPRLVISCLEKNQGVHVARNKGIDISTGNYIIFLDSDDTINPNALEVFVSIIKEKNAGWISAPYQVTSGVLSGINTEKSGWIPTADIFCEKNLRKSKAGLGCIKKTLISDIRFVAPNLDFIFYRKLTRKTRLYYYAYPLGVYYRAEESDSLHVIRKKPNVELSIIRAKELDKYLNEFEEEILSYCPRMLAANAYGAAVGLLLAGDLRRSRVRSFQCLKYGGSKFNFLAIFLLGYIPFGKKIMELAFLYDTNN